MDGVFRRIDDSDTDLRQVAVMQVPLPVSLAPETGQEPVYFRRYEANSLELEVNAKGAGLLVLSDVFYPGWRATVNGKRATIYKVDGALRGVLVEPGDNHITMNYAPLSFYFGAGVTLLTLAGLSFVLALNWRAGRLRSHSGTLRERVLEHRSTG